MSGRETVLVSGGAGYIGSVLTEKLLNRGYNVVVLDSMTYSDIGIRHLLGHSSLTVVQADIRDREAVRTALKNASYFIHLAAIANDPSGELDLELTRAVNLRVYPMLLEEAKKSGVRRFINASTFSVYGIKNEPNVTEDLPLFPLKEYSVCKAKSELLVREANTSSFVTVSLRCATLCGWSPRMRFDLIVNTLAANAVLLRKLRVEGGEQQRPQIHIQDLTDYFLALLTAPCELIGAEVFNAGGVNASIMGIAQAINDVLGGSIEIESAPLRADERSYHVSSEKIARVLGLVPTRTIQTAVKDIVTAYDKGLWKDPQDPVHHNVLRMKQLGFA